MSNIDSYLLHIEPKTLDRLNEARELAYERFGRLDEFDRIVYAGLGRYITALKYQIKKGAAQ